MQDLLQLPLQVQATLVAGYLGYIILKRDHRKTEKLSDMWLLIMLFGLPTALIIQFCDTNFAYLSILLPLLLAFIWVKYIEEHWSNFLYRSQVSNRLNDGDVWKTLSSYKNIAATQIVLTHRDGNCYLCEHTHVFNEEPLAPFTMDEDGIAFYVTHKMAKSEYTWKAIKDVKLDSDYGSLITYFPREDIKFLELRLTKQILRF